MKSTLFVPTVLALAFAAVPAFAQKESAPKQDAKPVSAAAPLVRSSSKLDLTIPVTGLTAENSAKVKTALEGMKTDLNTCPMCKASFAKTGDCPKCKTPLATSKEAVLGMVTTDVAKNQIVIQTNAGMELRLSSIERALQADAIKIDDRKLTIPGNATLVVSGAPVGDQVTSLPTALTDARLFQSAHAEASPMGMRIHVVANETAPDLAHVREVVVKSGPSFKVDDVIWNDWSPSVIG